MKIRIIETLAVEVEADTIDEVRAMYDRADIVLTADNFESVEFYPVEDIDTNNH